LFAVLFWIAVGVGTLHMMGLHLSTHQLGMLLNKLERLIMGLYH